MMMTKQKFLASFVRVPLLGGLVNCSMEDHWNAIQEIFSTVVISFFPLFIGYLVAWLHDPRTGILAFFASNLQNGELLLYVSALLAPVFFIVMRKRKGDRKFPHTFISIAVYGIIVVVAAVVFALRRVNYDFNRDSMALIQYSVFAVTLGLIYLVSVYNHSLIPDPASTMREEEQEFLASAREHRTKG